MSDGQRHSILTAKKSSGQMLHHSFSETSLITIRFVSNTLFIVMWSIFVDYCLTITSILVCTMDKEDKNAQDKKIVHIQRPTSLTLVYRTDKTNSLNSHFILFRIDK